MCGSATLTIAVSRTTISCAAAITNSATPSRRPAVPVPAAAPALDCSDCLTVMTVLLLGCVRSSGPLHRDQAQAKIADPVQQAVQGRLVGDHPGDDGAGAVAGDLQAVEPGGPVLAQHTLDPDLVAGGRGRHLCRPIVGYADIRQARSSGPGGRHLKVEGRVEFPVPPQGCRGTGSAGARQLAGRDVHE